MSQTQRTVLIVDDSPEDCESYRRYLLQDEEYQYTVVAAGLGQEGLALHQQHQPDIVLLDYRLPDLNGLEFLAQLKAQTQQTVLSVIMLTGKGNEAIAVQSMKMGAQDYLVKEQVTSHSLRLALNGAIEMVQLHIELHHRIELEQAARSEAEKANRIKDEFLALLSHELRSPLNPILGWAKLLQNRKLDEAKTAYGLATIERNAKLQAELIEDLLDVSRILQAKLSLKVNSVNLVATIAVALETVRVAAEAKSIEIETKLAAEVGQILGDGTRLQQVIWNLLSNAVKFTPEGGRVTVQLEAVGNQAQITVVDTGNGITADFLPYVFDYFRQADGSTTRKFGGLGLGLAIVRHLVELHGGEVWAESCGEGLGATFTVRLPLMPIQPLLKPDANSSKRSPNLSGVRVLLVEDEADSREFIALALEQAGASVSTATTAGEAFAVFTQYQIDILLSDIGMADMDGYMLVRQIRALSPEQGGNVPAIALTAYAGDFNQQQAFSAGFQVHLSKPVDPEQILKAIAQVVRRIKTTK
ncbi:hybrid sensor histidine kinase/response regulator [Nostoc commune]|uniref:ATP-binding response regulator n=1 Tax=Nostoc commune TaxID=1178 RepID=UPI0018C73A7A|nr:hybrid sensor histidine kinase/response regulator [Nostoc commune]MBG1263976.1 response regulator [Nostoc commune BAE]